MNRQIKKLRCFVLAFLLLCSAGCGRKEPHKTLEDGMGPAAEAESRALEKENQTNEKNQTNGTDKTTETERAIEIWGDGKAVGLPSDKDAEDGSESEDERQKRDETVRQRIIVATDVHYLAEKYAGNRCSSFMQMVENNDGRMLQYNWEVVDAFVDDMLEEEPDLLIISGDLTVNGEKKSHEEFAEKLEVLLDAGIPVLVIPGNHDINNPYARKFTSDGAKKAESVNAEEFESIYADFGFDAAESRDPASLSYVYHLDKRNWIMMLDSCQYEPNFQSGGMIKSDTYDWMERELDLAWEQGAEVITVSHHNLLDQSGVSDAFYDDCTIEHNEELERLLTDKLVRLHLSGHLHLQHYMQDEDGEIYEIVTGSLNMAPCAYGILDILEDDTYRYQTKTVDVEGWAKRHSYKNRQLAEFNAYSERFLYESAYKDAVRDLRSHTKEKKLFMTDETIAEMADFYARLCVYYYGGRMYEIEDEVRKEDAYEYWQEIDYASDLSSFLKNILNDEAKDFSYLEIPYEE